MQQSKASWHTVARALSNDELIALIRFFTVAESLPGWQAGNQSPVIWLNQVLKQRGVKLDRTLLQWIKAHSDNRFLPHGQL